MPPARCPRLRPRRARRDTRRDRHAASARGRAAPSRRRSRPARLGPALAHRGSQLQWEGYGRDGPRGPWPHSRLGGAMSGNHVAGHGFARRPTAATRLRATGLRESSGEPCPATRLLDMASRGGPTAATGLRLRAVALLELLAAAAPARVVAAELLVRRGDHRHPGG